MQITTLTSLLFLAASFASEAGAVNNPFSVLGPKRVEPLKEAPSNAASAKGASPKGTSRTENMINLSPPRKGPSRVEKMLNLNPPLKGSSRVEKMFNLNPPPKKMPGYKSEHGSVWEYNSCGSDSSMSKGKSESKCTMNNEKWAPSEFEAKGTPKEPTMTWDAAVKKGKEVWGELQVALRTKPPDKATSTTKLEDEGWHFSSAGDESEIDNLQRILGQLQLTPAHNIAHNNLHIRVGIHEVPPVPPGKGLRTAILKNAFNRQQGILIAMSNFKPEAETTPWSEVAFAKWYDSTWHRADPTNLNYVVRHNIENINTNFIMAEAHRKAGKPLTEKVSLWREGFGEAFYALMGTANGKGVPRMLKDHNEKLGRKTIKGIYTAKSADGQTHMIFALRNADAPKAHPVRTSKKIYNAALQMGLPSQASSVAAPNKQRPFMQQALQGMPKARNEHFTLLRRARQRHLEARCAYLQRVY
ncbi:hypothetical protein MMC30_004052 [Trapelia coarctata]|nr:hypothetical protein [Trapelia coarctata]